MEITCLDLSDKTAKTIKIISPRSAMISLVACEYVDNVKTSIYAFFFNNGKDYFKVTTANTKCGVCLQGSHEKKVYYVY